MDHEMILAQVGRLEHEFDVLMEAADILLSLEEPDRDTARELIGVAAGTDEQIQLLRRELIS